MPNDPSDYSDIFEYIEDEYRIDSGDDDFVRYHWKGAEQVEFVYKAYLAKIRMENDDVDIGWSLEIITLSRIYNDIADQKEKKEENTQDMMEKYGDIPEEGKLAIDTVFRMEVADSVLLYYTLANEIIRGMAAELVGERVFEVRVGDGIGFLKNQNHSVLANFLYHAGVADKKLKDEIINANKTRNRLVHEFTSRHYLEGISDVLPMVDRVNNVIDEMYDMLYEGRPLSD